MSRTRAEANRANAALSTGPRTAETAEELVKLDGYERKARSRRKKAFRALWE